MQNENCCVDPAADLPRGTDIHRVDVLLLQTKIITIFPKIPVTETVFEKKYEKRNREIAECGEKTTKFYEDVFYFFYSLSENHVSVSRNAPIFPCRT